MKWSDHLDEMFGIVLYSEATQKQLLNENKQNFIYCTPGIVKGMEITISSTNLQEFSGKSV